MSIFHGLGRALRWLRDRQGKRQYQVADAAGITKAMLSAYETGKQKPSLDTLEKILTALECDLNDLHNALQIVNERPEAIRRSGGLRGRAPGPGTQRESGRDGESPNVYNILGINRPLPPMEEQALSEMLRGFHKLVRYLHDSVAQRPIQPEPVAESARAGRRSHLTRCGPATAGPSARLRQLGESPASPAHASCTRLLRAIARIHLARCDGDRRESPRSERQRERPAGAVTRNGELERASPGCVTAITSASIYDTLAELSAVLVPFVQTGLAAGDRCLFVGPAAGARRLERDLRAAGVPVGARDRPRRPRPARASATAGCSDGRFDPWAMMDLLRQAEQQALDDGFSGLRATWDMTWILDGTPGAERLVEYEAHLNRFLAGSRTTALCRYARDLGLRRADPGRAAHPPSRRPRRPALPERLLRAAPRWCSATARRTTASTG